MNEALQSSRDVTVPAWLLQALPPGIQAWLLAGGEFSSVSLAWR